MAKNRKIRIAIQKNRSQRPRQTDWTRAYRDDDQAAEQSETTERVRAKGDASRHRTVQVDENDQLAVDEKDCLRGRVLTAQGLYCVVATADGKTHKCYTRRLLKSLAIDERSIVATGDWVWFRPAPGGEGLIVRVEARSHLLTRGYRHKEQVIAANIDQVLIVASLVDPSLKPGLIDRYLVSAEQGGLRPVICLNKADLVDAAHIAPVIGVYSQLGYVVALTSAATGAGIAGLRDQLRGHETVIVGQSGVGKSSLLNALEPALHLKVSDVSAATHKGRHTTTSSQLLVLPGGGTVVDTPGVRQFELWQIEPGEVEGYFIEFRPFVPYCRFPGCTHTHENDCAVKQAVGDRLINPMRYASYAAIAFGEAT